LAVLDFAVIVKVLPSEILEILQEVFGAVIVQLFAPLAVTKVFVTPVAGASIATTTLANFLPELPLAVCSDSVMDAIAGAAGFWLAAVEIEAAPAG
jgi:hypothetical protein